MDSKRQQPRARMGASFSPPGARPGRKRQGEGAVAAAPSGTPSLRARTRLRGLLVSHMDDGRAEATLAGDGHHALCLIGQGERAQGACHHWLLLRAGPLPAQHHRWICAERRRQLPPGGPWGGGGGPARSLQIRRPGGEQGRVRWGPQRQKCGDGASGPGRDPPGLYLSWPPKGPDPSSACPRPRPRMWCRRKRHTSAWSCWGCCSSPGTWRGTRGHEGRAWGGVGPGPKWETVPGWPYLRMLSRQLICW